MQRLTMAAVCLVTLMWPASGSAAEQAKAIDLFDGKSLDGWEIAPVDPAVKTEDVWNVRDGVLVCKGQPLGYLQTKEKFQNFKLSLQWRWAPGGKPGNSGVLLRIADKPVSFLPKCLECQLKSGSAGDLWGFYGYQLKGDAARWREIKKNPALGDFHGLGGIKTAEKEPGQWNTYEITLSGGDLTVMVNGELVNEATDCEVLAGSIGLQSEGAEIHFRNVRLVKLP